METVDSGDAILLSGGLDSAILLHRQLALGRRVQPLYIDCGLKWQGVERAFMQRFLAALACELLEPVIELSMPVHDLYGEHWSLTGERVPDRATPDEAVYLPGRNPLLLVKALLWCQLNGWSRLLLAPLGSNPFPDATDTFFNTFGDAMAQATGTRVAIERPFAQLHKSEVMNLGRNAPLEWTFSCIAPFGDEHCGACNKCHERQMAFLEARLADPTRYATKPPVGVVSR